eukprot:TRINITY_DN12665_c0_g1_i1.p1 TRINITY_DN12665_c0_g1~~TRINITY_DN12665_c0_g1_i1.p1  ORF type:complete len:201 (+),score=40.84 TRINITY_DN12665_c0_g1_i1:34-636(+)
MSLKLETAGDLASYIKGTRGRAASPRVQRNYTTPGNTAAIPLTLKALRANEALNNEDYYFPRAPVRGDEGKSAMKTEDSDVKKTAVVHSPADGRSPSMRSRTGRVGSVGPRAGSVGEKRSNSLKSNRSTMSTRSNMSKSSRLSSLAAPRQASARQHSFGVKPTMLSNNSRHVDPKRKPPGGGLNLSAAAINKASACYAKK